MLKVKSQFLSWVTPIPHSKATCSLIPIVYGIILFRGIRLTLSLYDKLGGINLSKRMIIGFVSIILFSGATICNTGYRQADYSDRSFITRMDELGCPDVIFIFGATNDCWAGAPLGEYKYGGWTKEDLYRFRPAMAYMLDHMIDRYPNVEIYFLLNSGLKEEFNESVRATCKHYGIDCIELHDIDKQSGHPSVKGMEQICDQIENFILKKDIE